MRWFWIVSLLNLAWCALQTWECTPGKAVAWNMLSLFTTSGMLFLEVSLIAFLLQGDYSSGLEALARTFTVSGLIVGCDIILKAIYMFGFGIPLFIENDDHTHQVKWGLWVVHKLVPTAVYGLILFMYHSKWRARLPGIQPTCGFVIIVQLKMCPPYVKLCS
ncbi:Cullin-associated NEDD8-dissociated protein 2 [Ancistrocladus abbreviatus]